MFTQIFGFTPVNVPDVGTIGSTRNPISFNLGSCPLIASVYLDVASVFMSVPCSFGLIPLSI